MKYYVYVIDLDKKVLKERMFKNANPNYNPIKPCVYVGQSAKTPENRFEQHLSGPKFYSRWVRKYGRRLRPINYKRHNPLYSRWAAEKKEKWLAENLRKKGYGVWYN